MAGAGGPRAAVVRRLPDGRVLGAFNAGRRGDAFLQALSEHHPGPRHQVGGYAAPVRGPVEYEVAAALGGGVRSEDPRLLAEQARWTLVTQVDTDDRAGMMRGDCGAWRLSELPGNWPPP